VQLPPTRGFLCFFPDSPVPRFSGSALFELASNIWHLASNPFLAYTCRVSSLGATGFDRSHERRLDACRASLCSSLKSVGKNNCQPRIGSRGLTNRHRACPRKLLKRAVRHVTQLSWSAGSVRAGGRDKVGLVFCSGLRRFTYATAGETKKRSD
jgi:hypothetical protein